MWVPCARKVHKRCEGCDWYCCTTHWVHSRMSRKPRTVCRPEGSTPGTPLRRRVIPDQCPDLRSTSSIITSLPLPFVQDERKKSHTARRRASNSLKSSKRSGADPSTANPFPPPENFDRTSSRSIWHPRTRTTTAATTTP